MAKGTSSKAPKPKAASAVKPTAPSPPPAPFSLPPPNLQPFLSTLDKTHIYITHIDTHPWPFKRRIFAVPILMNVAIVLLLAWRAYVAIPSYVAIALATLGYSTEAKVDLHDTDWTTLLAITVQRALMFLFDWSLLRFLGPWPLHFFAGAPANPTSWRRSVGFQDREVAVRVSRKWDQALPPGWAADADAKAKANPNPKGEHDDKEAVFRERIMPAIEPRWIRAKTAYLMMDKSWDLDFAAMMAAHRLVSTRVLRLDDFQTSVFLHSEPHGGWLVWPVHELDAAATSSQEIGRRKIVAFKDRLTGMGKENLFFRWIEIVQYESSQPGGFTAERQAVAMRKAREAFEGQGVDFEQFWRDVGGMEGMPGWES